MRRNAAKLRLMEKAMEWCACANLACANESGCHVAAPMQGIQLLCINGVQTGKEGPHGKFFEKHLRSGTIFSFTRV